MSATTARSWCITIPEYRMVQIVPKGWKLVSYSIYKSGRLTVAVKLAGRPFTYTVLGVSLDKCMIENHEKRLEWLRQVLELELLFSLSGKLQFYDSPD